MHLTYKNTKDEILAVMRQAKHEPPHLHHALELVWVKSGSLELGMGEELYHMQAGDVGILFPDLIHHYQVFSAGQNMAVFVNAPPFIVGAYEETLNQKAPKIPVLKASVIPEDVYRSFDALLTTKDIPIAQAYLQIILARCIKELTLTEKSSVESEDLIYRTVAYVSAHFNHAVSLEEMAKALGVSKYVLSRIFSKTFHRNFNQYLNDARLGLPASGWKPLMIRSQRSVWTAALRASVPLIGRSRNVSKCHRANTVSCSKGSRKKRRNNMEYLTMTIREQKNIALIAHDGKKQEMLQWCIANREILKKHHLCGTGTTARMITEQAGLSVKGYNSGPLGGDQQVGAKIVEGQIDMVIFFSDPLTAQPHDPDVKALLRIAQVYDIPIANNKATADFLMHSTFMDTCYEHQVENFKQAVEHRAATL